MRHACLPAARSGMLTTLGLALLLLTGGGLRRSAAEDAPAQPRDRPTEQRWVIGAVAKDLVNMAAFAAAPEHWSELPASAVDVRGATGEKPGLGYTLSVQLPGGGEPIRTDLRIAGTVWSPELYVPTIRAVFERLKITPPTATNGTGALPEAELLKALAAPLTSEIEARNQQISGWLQTHPLDAGAHEQAALLLGTLAMRENSGLLWNPRGACNRAAAHLALARAIRAEASESGRVSELLIGLILDTKADCQRRIADLQAQVSAHPELGPWITAATLRNTRDYRVLANPHGATLLERIELFRATSEAISGAQAIERMEGNFQPETTPDWARIVIQVGFSVGSGHRFAIPSTGLEVNDAALVFPDLPTARAPAQFAAILNVPPGDAVQAGKDGHARWQVIDRGAWAQFFQRHLLQAADETYNFLKYKWGVPEEANEFRVQVGSMVRRLTLYPLCLDYLGKEDGEALYQPAADLVNQHPEWVSDGGWTEVVRHVPASDAAGSSWALVNHAWFSPAVPTGTVYGVDWRLMGGAILPTPGLPVWQKLHEIAPIKYSVCQRYAIALAPEHQAVAARFKEVMGPLLAYYLPALLAESDLVHGDPAQYGEVMNRITSLEPSYFLTLGQYYVAHRMEPEAAQAYQAAIDKGADAIGVSADSSWLVNYYYDHGQRDRAMTVARFAAEVYSFRGLETMANLLERMGKTAEAESYYKKIDERYNSSAPLDSFYARTAASHPEYADKMKAAMMTVFPDGMETVTLGQLTGKPTKGVYVNGENALSREAGLLAGAIIVGLDSKRVSNMDQYTFVRGLKDSPDLDLLVYQGEHYQAIRAHVPGRLFNLDFVSWPWRND